MDVEQLRGRAVVSVQQAEKIGTVHDVLVDTSAHRLAGLVLQGGLFRGGPSIAWADVRTIGQDAVMVDDRRAAANATVDGAVKLADLRGRKVVTDSGELAGTIDGLDFDPETGTIAHYIVAGQSGGLFRTAPRYQLPPKAVAAVGDGLITVDARTIDFQRAPQPEPPPAQH